MYSGTYEKTKDPNSYILHVNKTKLASGINKENKTVNAKTINNEVLIIKRSRAYVLINGYGMIKFNKQDSDGTAVEISD